MLKSVIVSALSLLVITWYLPGVTIANDNFSNPEFWVVLGITAVVLTFLFSVIQPILTILTLPITIVTLGLFSTVINVALLWFAVYLVPSFTIIPMTILGIALNYFFSLLFVSIMLGFTQSVFKMILK